MSDAIDEKTLKIFDSVRRHPTPNNDQELREAKISVVSATLWRSQVAGKFRDRVQTLAKIALRMYMEALSIKYTEQRWAQGLEFAMWKAATETRNKMSEVEAVQLMELSVEAGGWWAVPRDTDEPEFVSRDEWLISYEDWNE